MTKIEWMETLGWDESQIEDIRFLGYHYIRQGKYDIARVFFEGIIAFVADRPLQSQLSYDFETLGAIYLQLGNNARALRYLERALRMDSKNTIAALNKVKALLALRRTESALVLARKLTKSKDNIVRDRAEALIMGQKLKEARRIEQELSAVAGRSPQLSSAQRDSDDAQFLEGAT